MKIGLVSDSHGKAKRLRRAVAALRDRGAEAIVHCGDIGSEECLLVLAESGLPCYAVAGNMDHHPDRLAARAGESVTFHPASVVVDLSDGTTLAATHGNDPALLAGLIAAGHAYVCHGHTHQVRNERVGSTRVLNPGAVRGHPGSAALLDAAADTFEPFDVD